MYICLHPTALFWWQTLPQDCEACNAIQQLYTYTFTSADQFGLIRPAARYIKRTFVGEACPHGAPCILCRVNLSSEKHSQIFSPTTKVIVCLSAGLKYTFVHVDRVCVCLRYGVEQWHTCRLLCSGHSHASQPATKLEDRPGKNKYAIINRVPLNAIAVLIASLSH